MSNDVSAAEPPVRQFLAAHCAECHGAETQEAGLRLDTLAADFATPESFAAWVKIHDRLRDGEMPPQDSPQPPPEQRRAVVEQLAAQLTAADSARRRAEGRAVLRRLNRTEYENTLRDLFGLPGLKVKELLPEDGQAFGFDKSAYGLDLSYVQLAKYMETADVVLDAAIAPHADRPALFEVHIPGGGCQSLFAQAFLGQTVFLKDFQYDDSFTPISTTRITKNDDVNKLKRSNLKHPHNGSMGLLVPEGVGAFKPRFPFRVIVPGKYRIPGVVGSAIRRVPLPADCQRGGFLTQASVLKVTANGTVTSPVKRGAWVMRKIIGRPPDLAGPAPFPLAIRRGPGRDVDCLGRRAGHGGNCLLWNGSHPHRPRASLVRNHSRLFGSVDTSDSRSGT